MGYFKAWIKAIASPSESENASAIALAGYTLHHKPGFEKSANLSHNLAKCFKWWWGISLRQLFASYVKPTAFDWVLLSQSAVLLPSELAYAKQALGYTGSPLVIDLTQPIAGVPFYVRVQLKMYAIAGSFFMILTPYGRKNRNLYITALPALLRGLCLKWLAKKYPSQPWLWMNPGETGIVWYNLWAMQHGVHTSICSADLPVHYHSAQLLGSRFIIQQPLTLNTLHQLPNLRFNQFVKAEALDVFQYRLAGYAFNNPTTALTIGIISSGYEVRKNLNRYFDLLSTGHKMEKALLVSMARFAKKYQHIKVVLLLHPLEKRNNELKKIAINYFNSIFDGAPITIHDGADLNSWQYFSEINITLAYMSTLGAQRWATGYKHAYVNNNVLAPYVAHTSMEKAFLATDAPDFDEQLMALLALKSSDFLFLTGLTPLPQKSEPI